MEEPSSAIETLDPLVSALRGWGAPVDDILARAELAPTHLDDKRLRIPHSQFQAVWIAARELTQDAAIGLHVIEHFDPNRLNLPMYLASTCATPREAYERASRYARISHDALEVDLWVEDERTVCRSRFRGCKSDRSIAEYAVGLILKVAPYVVERELGVEVWFQHPNPGYQDEYDRVLGYPVHFEASCDGFVGGVQGMDDPLPHANAGLSDLLEAHAAEQLRKIPEQSNFADRVRDRLAAVLPEGDAAPERIARSLGVSARTLRRKLKDCGASYTALLDDVRCDLAKQALGRRDMSVGEVALLLGFSDASAFNKAFRRWTGKRPSDWR